VKSHQAEIVERVVTIMSIGSTVVYCADETGKTYSIEQSVLYAAGVLAPALGQRLIASFASATSADVLSVRLPS
jgi:hypothetical protein